MIRVLLADDHSIVREGLATLLEQKGRLKVVANVATGTRALEMALAEKPDVAILDITMPEMNGIEVCHRLHLEDPDIHVIILSMHADRQYILEALRAGARGYVLKDSAYKDLRSAINQVMSGGVYLSPRITPIVVDQAVHGGDRHRGETPYDILSSREREVLQMLAEGQRAKDIADILMVSLKTVETHRKRIMDKLDLHSIAELTKYAIRHGLTDLE
ncbi:MAG TPA: response regulator transcription factor [bacterium]|nr:response regulator transcription factor [bacterium]